MCQTSQSQSPPLITYVSTIWTRIVLHTIDDRSWPSRPARVKDLRQAVQLYQRRPRLTQPGLSRSALLGSAAAMVPNRIRKRFGGDRRQSSRTLRRTCGGDVGRMTNVDQVGNSNQLGEGSAGIAPTRCPPVRPRKRSAQCDPMRNREGTKPAGADPVINRMNTTGNQTLLWVVDTLGLAVGRKCQCQMV